MLWGERLLRAQPQIKILVKCPIASRLLDVIGLGGERVVCAGGRDSYAENRLNYLLAAVQLHTHWLPN